MWLGYGGYLGMELILVILGFALLIIGIIGAIVPVLPGPPLSFIGMLLVQWSGFGSFSPSFIIIWAGIVVVITILDFVLPSFMTKRFGGSRAARVGSFLGLLVGLFLFPPWGMIIGPFLGAYTGELLSNQANGVKAFKVALGAFFAFIVGSGAKLVVGVLLLFYALRAVF